MSFSRCFVSPSVYPVRFSPCLLNQFFFYRIKRYLGLINYESIERSIYWTGETKKLTTATNVMTVKKILGRL